MRQGTSLAEQRAPQAAPFRQPTRKQLQLVDQEQLPPLGLSVNAPRPGRLNLSLNAPGPAPLNTARLHPSASEGTGTRNPGPARYAAHDLHTAPPPGFFARRPIDVSSTADSGWGEPYMPPPAPAAPAPGPRAGTGVFVPQRMGRR